LFSSPNHDKREIWLLLLEKALAKAYGGYHKLYSGNETYILRDLTGAPVIAHQIVNIPDQQQINQRELQYMAQTWKKLQRSLSKGYLIYFVPRKPTKEEAQRNNDLKIFNKKDYLGKGIYCSHSYAILGARDIIDKTGTERQLIHLRNPWLNEKWTGQFNSESTLWSDNLKDKMKFNP
jgi:calpain-15